MIRSEKKN